MKDQKKIRLGLIGVGNWALFAHVRVLRLLRNTILFGRTVRGIIEGDSIPEIFIPRLIDLYTQGRFPFDRLIRKYQFEEINQAVQDSEQGQVFKPVLMMAG